MNNNDKFLTELERECDLALDECEAVAKSSISDLVEEVLTPVSKGGNMRVDTGFLRSSGVATTSGPVQINENAKPSSSAPNSFAPDMDAIDAVILTLQPGDTFYFSFTASYALIREYKDGFVRLAAQRWDTIVEANKAKAAAMNRG